MAIIIRLESRRKFEKQGLAKTRQVLQRGGHYEPHRKCGSAELGCRGRGQTTTPGKATLLVVVRAHPSRCCWSSLRSVANLERVDYGPGDRGGVIGEELGWHVRAHETPLHSEFCQNTGQAPIGAWPKQSFSKGSRCMRKRGQRARHASL